MEKEIVVYATWNDGTTIEVTGNNLEDIANQLNLENYDGPTIRVYKENGETLGWVGAGTWRYA